MSDKVLIPHPEEFQPFEGQAVATAGVEVRNAGGGLQKALDVEPGSWQIGDSLLLVMRVDVVGVNLKPIPGAEDMLQRVHVMRATDTTPVEFSDENAGLIVDLINTHATRVQRKRAEARGEDPLFDEDGNVLAGAGEDQDGGIDAKILDPFGALGEDAASDG